MSQDNSLEGPAKPGRFAKVRGALPSAKDTVKGLTLATVVGGALTPVILPMIAAGAAAAIAFSGGVGFAIGLGLAKSILKFGLKKALNDPIISKDFSAKDREHLTKAYHQLLKQTKHEWTFNGVDKYEKSKQEHITELLEELSEGQRNTLRPKLEIRCEPFLDAQKYYNSFLTELGRLTTEKGGYSAESIIEDVKRSTDELRKGIVAQQAFEKTQLSSAGVPEDTLKKLTEKQKAQHDAELKTFDDAVNESKNALHNESQKQTMNLAYILHMREMNEKNNLLLDVPPRMVAHEAANNGAEAHIELTDLNKFYTKTGKMVKQGVDEKKGEFNLGFDSGLWSPMYFLSPNKIVDDIQELARFMKEGLGKESITMDVNFTDDGLCKERAKQAYQACLQAGYPPEKITIKMNGKKIEDVKKDLFENDKENLIEGYKSIGEKRNTDTDSAFKDVAETTKAHREHLEQLRKLSRTRERKEEATPPTPTPS